MSMAKLIVSKTCWLRDTTKGLTFNNCKLYPHCIFVICIYLKTKSELGHLQHKLIVFITQMKVFTARYVLGR